MVGLFIPVWSREKGALAEPAAAVQAAVEAYARLVGNKKPKQKKK